LETEFKSNRKEQQAVTGMYKIRNYLLLCDR